MYKMGACLSSFKRNKKIHDSSVVKEEYLTRSSTPEMYYAYNDLESLDRMYYQSVYIRPYHN